MRELTLTLLFIIFCSYSYSQNSFNSVKVNEVREKVKSIFLRKKISAPQLKSESIVINDIVSNEDLTNESENGVYVVKTDPLYFGNYFLLKSQQKFTLYNISSIKESLFDEVLNIKDLSKRDKKKYLKSLYHYYIYFLERKSKKELLIIPKDSAAYVDIYKKKKKRKYSNKKRQIRKKYKEYLKRID